ATLSPTRRISQATRRDEEFHRYRDALFWFSRFGSLPYTLFPTLRTLCNSYHCLARPLAQISDDAFFAQRLACNTSVTAVQNKPMVCMLLVFCRYHLLQFHFDLERGLARGQPCAVSDTKNVRIDGYSRLGEGNIEDDVCGLAADAGQ